MQLLGLFVLIVLCLVVMMTLPWYIAFPFVFLIFVVTILLDQLGVL